MADTPPAAAPEQAPGPRRAARRRSAHRARAWSWPRFVTGAATAGPAGATSVEDTFTAKLNTPAPPAASRG